MSVPNQKNIIIKKEICNKDNLYLTTNIIAMKKAMNDLNGETFKLWMYFSKNKNNYSFNLSQKDAAEWGLKKTTYYDNIKKLIQKGYLQQKKENSNIFYFTEIAFSEIRKEEEEKENIISENWNIDSEKRTEISEKRTEISDFQQRNNINNIETINNNTIEKGGKAANNLDEDCISLLDEIYNDYLKGKFNDTQIKEIQELEKYLLKNKEKETTITLYNKILEIYLTLYKELYK